MSENKFSDETLLLARIETLEAELARKQKSPTPWMSLPTRQGAAFSAATTVFSAGWLTSVLLAGYPMSFVASITAVWSLMNIIAWTMVVLKW